MSRADLLVEIGTEEIPAGYLPPVLGSLEEGLRKTLSDGRFEFEKIAVWGTPRRLALAVWELSDRQADTTTEVIGPPVRAAYDSNGQPTRAASGFAQSQGVDVSKLLTVEMSKGKYLAVRKELKDDRRSRYFRN